MSLEMDRTWGWRGRVGLIMPAPQTVTEPLFYTVAPEGISFHTARLQITGIGRAGVTSMEEHVPGAIDELAQARVQCIAYLCVGSGLQRGREAEEQFCAAIEKRTGIPVVSALLSTLKALDALRIKKIVVADPYIKEMNELERNFLTTTGFQVLGVHGLGLADSFQFGQVTARDIHAFCRRVWDPRADGLYISCCAFNGMAVAELLENELKVPVVTAHSAVLWQVLRVLGIREPVPGYGRLLREYCG